MAVFRIERTRDYTVMSNHHLRNANLSLKAKGLLSMMLSLPEDWNYTTRGLAKICKEGVDAIGAALRELEAAGYIVRHKLRDRQGRIESRADDVCRAKEELRTTPVYPHSAAYASEHGEMAQYNLSYQANSACKEAIEQTISAHYAENRLDTEAAVKDVLEKFGTERVQFILANTIQRKNHDGRISQDNKAWAKTIPMPEDSGASRHCAYLVVDGVNPGLTDLFTRQFRKVAQEQQKSSVLQKLRQEPPARKPAAPKKREPER